MFKLERTLDLEVFVWGLSISEAWSDKKLTFDSKLGYIIFRDLLDSDEIYSLSSITLVSKLSTIESVFLSVRLLLG
jgi:hypothetical protein